MRFHHPLITLSLIAALSVCAAGQDKNSDAKSAEKPTVAKGETVPELDKAIWHVFQARNNDYWFASHDRGVYRYHGKTLVNFTKKDGLSDNNIGLGGIQEDIAGNIYFNTAKGISRFDGTSFTTLNITKSNSTIGEWKLQPDDLWFRGASDSAAVYRYDGKLLHHLEFPKTKAGEEHIAQHPRSKYPNIKSSPYDVFTIFKDSKGHLWFGTAILGVCRYDGKPFAWLPENELRNGSFGTRSISEDKEGRFWFCKSSHRYAVDLSDSAEPKFRKVEGLRDANDPKTLPIEGIMSSTRDSSGAIWMATYGMGVWRYDGNNITHYPVKDGNKSITLFSIQKDHQGVIWLGTQESGAYKFNGKTLEKFRP